MNQRVLIFWNDVEQLSIINQSHLFCCKSIYKHLNEKEVAIIYGDIIRSFGIRILDGGSSYQEIKCCPWCGNKFPKELRDEFFDIIYDELNLDGPDDPRLPEEFKSREWWVKRGL